MPELRPCLEFFGLVRLFMAETGPSPNTKSRCSVCPTFFCRLLCKLLIELYWTISYHIIINMTYCNYMYHIIVLSYHSIVLYSIYYYHDIIIWFALQANHYSCIILHEHNTTDPFWLQGSDILTALGIDDTKTLASPGSNNRCQEWISTGRFLCVKDEWNPCKVGGRGIVSPGRSPFRLLHLHRGKTLKDWQSLLCLSSVFGLGCSIFLMPCGLTGSSNPMCLCVASAARRGVKW